MKKIVLILILSIMFLGKNMMLPASAQSFCPVSSVAFRACQYGKHVVIVASHDHKKFEEPYPRPRGLV